MDICIFYLKSLRFLFKLNYLFPDADGKEIEHTVTYTDDDLVQMVEGALKQADANDDGYITYAEFRSATGNTT